MGALLDTDILSELERDKNEQVRAHARAYESEHGPLAISAITIFEVLHGWHQAHRPDRAEAFLGWLEGADILSFDAECAKLAGEIGGILTRTGRAIGLADVAIAATALRHRRVLITGNIQHHERVRAAGFALDILSWRDP